MNGSAWLAAIRDDLVFVRQRLLVGVTALEHEDLDFQPVPTVMSPRAQALHVAWAEHQWRSRARGTEPAWAEPAERVPATVDELVAALTAERALTMVWLATLSEHDLASPVLDRDGRVLSVVWVLNHLVRHDAHHAGQLILLWRLRHPDAAIPSGYGRVLDQLKHD